MSLYGNFNEVELNVFRPSGSDDGGGGGGSDGWDNNERMARRNRKVCEYVCRSVVV